MKPRTLLVLLVLVLGLGSYIWFYDKEQPSSEERTELEKKAIPLKKDEVTAVSLQSDAGTVRLEKAGQPAPKKEKKEDDELAVEPSAEWRIVEPLKARADTTLVEGLLDALGALDTVRKLDDVNPKEVGLDQPRATVKVKTADGEKVLKIGAEIPTSGTTIAALEGTKGAVVVSDSILTDIRRNPGDWRDRQIYRGDRDHVQRITLASGSQKVVLAKQGDSFRIESPIKDRADRDKVDDLFAELSGLTAERFVDGGAPIQPQTVVEVISDEAPPFRIDLGAEVETPAPEGEDPMAAAKTYEARSGGQQFEIRTRLAEAAARPAAEWRATSLSSLETFEVETATVQDAQGSLSLNRAEPDWKRGKDTISYLPVSDFLFSLVGAKADRLLTPDEAVAVGITPNGKPVLTITLGTKGKGQETLKLFAPVAAGTPATASDRNLILLLPPGTLGEVQGKLAEVRKAKPVEAK
ncbi:MAG TPA: DUF4340 domain-containing protein [Thermoanaerobaculia bacterium]|jgi:hypothetical protein|nr:DUF4340 domain-containing protein [Thermoanaerobaculia bacterium]